jgi:hypothetical protein
MQGKDMAMADAILEGADVIEMIKSLAAFK